MKLTRMINGSSLNEVLNDKIPEEVEFSICKFSCCSELRNLSTVKVKCRMNEVVDQFKRMQRNALNNLVST